jgi:hypothetical protein
MTDIWIQNAIKYWKSEKTELSPGTDLNSVISLEKDIGIKLPIDFVEFYQIVNGFKNLGVNNNLFCIWSIEKIRADYTISYDKEFIGFGDYMMASHEIGFFKNIDGVFNDYDLEKPLTNSFKEFIHFINSPLTDSRFVIQNKI